MRAYPVTRIAIPASAGATRSCSPNRRLRGRDLGGALRGCRYGV